MRLRRKKDMLIETYGTLLIDILAIACAYLIARRLRIMLPFGPEITEQTVWFPAYILCILGCILYNLSMNRYEFFFQRGFFVEGQEVLKYNIVQFVFLSSCVYLFRLELDFSRLMLIYFIVCNIALDYLFRVLFKSLVNHTYKNGRDGEKILIVTDTEVLEQVEEHLQRDRGWSYEVVGVALVDRMRVMTKTQTDSQGGVLGEIEGWAKKSETGQTREESREWKIVAGREDLLDVARQMPIDLVFFYCTPKAAGDRMEGWIQAFLMMGIPCYYCVQNINFSIPSSGVGEFAEFPVMCYNLMERDWRMSILKRMMDIVGGFVGLLITALFTPFLAIAIKAEDPKGPVFFSQIRIGKNGRRFRLYKFRSMYADAEQRKKELMASNEMQGPMFKMENDPRITKVGKILRRTSLDELPQFWNIFKGDMSLVGTRPPTVDEFERYNDYYRRRMSITPGLTGLWQVSGRSDIKDFDEVVKLDLQYIDNWSLGQDVKILLQTVGVVLRGNGSR